MITENLTAYFKNAMLDNWDKKSLCDYNNGALTYGEVANQILKIHQLFKKQKIEKGDKIALIGKNSANWGTVYIATVTYGAVIVPLLQDFKPNDVYKLINHSDAKLLFGSDFILKDLETDNFEQLKCIYNLDDFSLHHTCKDNKIQFPDENYTPVPKTNFTLEEVPNDELAAILYTSGTSGRPKGVMLKHNSLAANLKYARANMHLTGGDRIVSFLPMAHSYGCAFEFLYPFSLGCTITFLGKIPAPNVVVKVFQEIQPRLILTVPLVIEKVYKNNIKPVLKKPAVQFMSKIPGFKNLLYKKIRKSLDESFGDNFKEVVIGGAKLNREVEIFLRKIKFHFSVGYGMTECGPLITYDGWKTTKIHSAGKPIDSLEVKIDSENPAKKVGEILMKGENVMEGYYKDKEETERTFTEDGWMRSGDLGLLDADNYLFIKGRNKSMILGASGKNIYPEEIESKLSNKELIGECLVVGRNNKIVAMVYPDHEKRIKNGIHKIKIPSLMDDYKQEVNDALPTYMHISKIQIREEEFKKTPKKSIKRYLYE
ncbi:MAG: AMP-binding protein [Bacteroidota bacterium]|nr:AMP-binding protein [Bacteroidota bacterium]